MNFLNNKEKQKYDRAYYNERGKNPAVVDFRRKNICLFFNRTSALIQCKSSVYYRKIWIKSLQNLMFSTILCTNTSIAVQMRINWMLNEMLWNCIGHGFCMKQTFFISLPNKLNFWWQYWRHINYIDLKRCVWLEGNRRENRATTEKVPTNNNYYYC